MEELFYQVLLLLATLLVADKVDTITWLTKDMVKYPLKKLNNDSKDLVVGGLNSIVLLDCSPAERIETSSTLTFGTRATTTASSTLTPDTCNADKHSSERNNNLADRPEQHETQQTQLSGEKGGNKYKRKKCSIETMKLAPAPQACGGHQS